MSSNPDSVHFHEQLCERYVFAPAIQHTLRFSMVKNPTSCGLGGTGKSYQGLKVKSMPTYWVIFRLTNTMRKSATWKAPGIRSSAFSKAMIYPGVQAQEAFVQSRHQF
jgi:hypothetical protein